MGLVLGFFLDFALAFVLSFALDFGFRFRFEFSIAQRAFAGLSTGGLNGCDVGRTLVVWMTKTLSYRLEGLLIGEAAEEVPPPNNFSLRSFLKGRKIRMTLVSRRWSINSGSSWIYDLKAIVITLMAVKSHRAVEQWRLFVQLGRSAFDHNGHLLNSSLGHSKSFCNSFTL